MQELDADQAGRLAERIATDDAFRPDPDDPGPARWWEALAFDPVGASVTYQGENRSAEALSRADPELARYAAALLKNKLDPADVNNRALAMIFTDPEKIEEPKALLAGLEGKSNSEANLAVIDLAPVVAIDE